MSNPLTLHLIQWRVIPGSPEENFSKAGDLIASAAPGKGDLVLLPEMFPSGFFYEALERMADRYQDVLSWMGGMADHYGVGIAGSTAVRRPQGVGNTMALVNALGEVAASYDKVHLFSVGDENLHFTAGERTVVAGWEGFDVGLAICFDLRFPEMTRKLCDDGAQITLVSAQWPQARIDHFRDLSRVRAMENQMFVVSCNSCGDDGKGLLLGGCSTVVGPAGDVKGSLQGDEGVLSVRIDVGEVEGTRESFPVLKIRRRDVFGN